MKVRYICDACGAVVSELTMPRLDEERLGFNALTAEERREIISTDALTGTVTVNSLCDDCVEDWEERPGPPAIH